MNHRYLDAKIFEEKSICDGKICQVFDYSEADDMIFVRPSMEISEKIVDFRNELLAVESEFHGCLSLKRMPDPEEYVSHCINWTSHTDETAYRGTYGNVIFAIRKSDGRLIGSLQTMHIITDEFLLHSGHVGLCVRPSERRKGYAKKILVKAVKLLAAYGWDEIIASCEPTNIGSKKTILAGGGRYIGNVTLPEDGIVLERYVITV